MRKSVRRATVVLALTPLVSVPMGVAAFATTAGSTSTVTTTTTPAPPGDASAVAAQVDGVITVAGTSATAASSGSGAHADALDLLGQRVSGGDQTTTGSSSGNLIGTGPTPLGDAELAPWSAQVQQGSDSSTAKAEAALAHVNLANAVELWLLHSQSTATWTGDKSTGDSSSDGAEVSALGALDVKVLHSEAHSGAKGKSDLLVINGNEIGSSDQANGMCEIPADPLIHLLCLTADGGTSSTGVTTSDGTVVTVSIGGGQLNGTISNSSTKAGLAQTPAAGQQNNGGSTAAGHVTNGSRLPHTSGPAVGSLPFTGSDAGRLAALGLAFAALGSAMLAFARRTRGMLAL
ncbi:MAG TPA: hypothetical protein VFH66_11995 [Mycobacteriales bacterium]|nr:hypothetical protein [Mycobacteriales bacterium]